MLGFCAGAVLMWLFVRYRPNLWRDAPQNVLVAGLSFQLVGAAAYACVAQQASSSRERDPKDAFDTLGPLLKDLLPHALIISRFVSGIGSGSCQQFYVSGMLHLTPVSDRSVHTGRWVFSGMIAIGLGPVLAAVLRQLEPCAGAHFELVGYAQIIAAIVSMVALKWLHPDLEDCEDCMESKYQQFTDEDVFLTWENKIGERWKQRLIVMGCLCMASLRAFGVSAIEVVIAMILEQQYDWAQRLTGLTIGGIFLGCIPVKLTHSHLSDRLAVTSWIRILVCIALMGSWLLFAPGRGVLPIDGALQLIIAGVIVFPTFYLSDALSSGLMHQNVLPEVSLFDGNHAQLWYNLMQGMGRFLGPWLARWTVEANGQDSFAFQQMLVTCIFIGIFETLVQPFLKTQETKQAGFVLPKRGDSEYQASESRGILSEVSTESP